MSTEEEQLSSAVSLVEVLAQRLQMLEAAALESAREQGAARAEAAVDKGSGGHGGKLGVGRAGRRGADGSGACEPSGETGSEGNMARHRSAKWSGSVTPPLPSRTRSACRAPRWLRALRALRQAVG